MSVIQTLGSAFRGPVDEELIENAPRVFDLRVVVARSVEGRSVWPNTREIRGERRTKVAMDNSRQVGRRPRESQRSNYRSEGFGPSSDRVATSDATLRRLICTCTFVNCPWICDRWNNWHFVMRPWSKNALMSRRWEILCNNFTSWHRRSKRPHDNNSQSPDRDLCARGTPWSPNRKHPRCPWRHFVEWPKGPCVVGRRRCFHANPQWRTAQASPTTYIRWRANWVPGAGNRVSVWPTAMHWRPCSIFKRSWWCRWTNKMSCWNAACCEGDSSYTPRRKEDRRWWNARIKITTRAYDPPPWPTSPKHFDSIWWIDCRLCLWQKDLG